MYIIRAQMSIEAAPRSCLRLNPNVPEQPGRHIHRNVAQSPLSDQPAAVRAARLLLPLVIQGGHSPIFMHLQMGLLQFRGRPLALCNLYL